MADCTERIRPADVLDVQDLPADWPVATLPLVGPVAQSKCAIAHKDGANTPPVCIFPGESKESCPRARRVASIEQPGADVRVVFLGK